MKAPRKLARLLVLILAVFVTNSVFYGTADVRAVTDSSMVSGMHIVHEGEVERLNALGIVNIAETYDSFVLAELTEYELSILSDSGIRYEDMQDRMRIKFGMIIIDTNSYSDTHIPEDLRYERFPDGNRHYYIVQFIGPIRKAWLVALNEVGVDLVDYVQNYGFIAKMTQKEAKDLVSLPYVHWVGTYHPAYKIAVGEDFLGNEFVVALHKGESTNRVLSSLKDEGIEILDTYGSRIGGSRIIVKADRSQVQYIALSEEVAYVGPSLEPVLLNDVAVPIDEAPEMWNTYIWRNNLRGDGQVISVMDSGLDTGANDATLTDDIEGRVLLINDLSGDGPDDVCSGHGTHVVGTILGDGALSGGTIMGAAPDANLVFHAMEYRIGDNCALSVPSPGFDTLNILESDYIDFGARVYSNSWGAVPATGIYAGHAATYDEFIWNYPDAVVLFAAGNSGRDFDADGVVDPNHGLTADASAKNIITVGGSENYRGDTFGFANRYGDRTTYGAYKPGYWPANPIWSDYMADDSNGMAAYSSRGTTHDGRIKPDVIAPATWVLSLKSSHADYPEAFGAWGRPSDAQYSKRFDPYFEFMGGTSMATPQVAGAAALIRERYQDITGGSPSAALIKATLINGALDMFPGQYGVGPTQDVDPRPHAASQGWGRLSLSNSARLDQGHALLFKDNEELFLTGESYTTSITVELSTEPLIVTLVWSDYPYSGIPQGDTLINDLDLEVIDSFSGVTYHGNQMVDGWSDGSIADHDRKNNVEEVAVESIPSARSFTIRVVAHNIIHGPQPFALVVSGADTMAPSAGLTIDGGASKTSSQTVQLEISGSDNLGVSMMRFRNEGSKYTHTIAKGLESPHGIPVGPALEVIEVYDPSEFLRFVENDHPYPNVAAEYVWTVQVPTGSPFNYPTAYRMRVGFSMMELACAWIPPKFVCDSVEVWDGYGNLVKRFGGDSGGPFEVVWTPYFDGDTAEIRLKTKGYGSKYGFQGAVYFYQTTAPFNPYSIDPPISWKISGNHRTQVHFDYIRTMSGARLCVSANNPNECWQWEDLTDVWTGTMYGEVIVTFYAPSPVWDGFRVDGIKASLGYPVNEEMIARISEPGSESLQARFSTIDLGPGDVIEVYDQNSNLLGTFTGSHTGVWTPTNPSVEEITIRFVTDIDFHTGWGYDIDLYRYYDYAWSGWEPFSTGKSWTLSGGYGTKTVCVELIDFAGNQGSACDSIDYVQAPDPPPNLEVMKVSNPDIQLDWDDVPDADYYNVYESQNRFAAFPSGWTLLGQPPNSVFIHSGAWLDGLTHYYRVTSFGYGEESKGSTMGVKSSLDFTFNPSSTNIWFMSLPYVCEYARASDISGDLGEARIEIVSRWNRQTKQMESWYYARGRWRGYDFTMNAGDGIYVGIVSSFEWVIVGTDSDTTLHFEYVAGSSYNDWFSLPYTGTYEKASDIVEDIEGGLGPPAYIVEVGTWLPSSQTYVEYFWNPVTFQWQGVDFDISQGDGVYLVVQQDLDWAPELVCPPVP